MKYTIRHIPVKHDGRLYLPGETIELDKAAAGRLEGNLLKTPAKGPDSGQNSVNASGNRTASSGEETGQPPNNEGVQS
nr:MAG TPA: hypothetical protein [Caudoviricetes sp.]